MKINHNSQKYEEFLALTNVLEAKPFPECENKVEFTLYAGALCGLVALYNSENWLIGEAEEIEEKFYNALSGFYMKLATGRLKGWLSQNDYEYEKAVGNYLRDAFKTREVAQSLQLMQQYVTETTVAIEVMKIIDIVKTINE